MSADLNPYDRIAEDLFIGGVAAYAERDALLQAGVRTALSVAFECVPDTSVKGIAAVRAMMAGGPQVTTRLHKDVPGSLVYYAWLDDNNDPEAQRGEILRASALLGSLIDKGPVLVTCFEGRNRSALVIATYLVLHLGVAPDAAIALICSRRPRTLTNLSFCSWLRGLR